MATATRRRSGFFIRVRFDPVSLFPPTAVEGVVGLLRSLG
jgi:hypothetical protein